MIPIDENTLYDTTQTEMRGDRTLLNSAKTLPALNNSSKSLWSLKNSAQTLELSYSLPKLFALKNSSKSLRSLKNSSETIQFYKPEYLNFFTLRHHID